MLDNCFNLSFNPFVYSSSPVFAGMLSLVNANRLGAGKSTLGWITPSIYASNGAFCNDITSGNNFCTAESTSCCNIGYVAETGWGKS